MEWFKFPDKQPEKEGHYLTATLIDSYGEDGAYCYVDVAEWLNEGHFINCSTSEVERIRRVMQQHFTPALKDCFFNELIDEPMGYHVSRSGFYDSTPGPDGRRACISKTTRYWAELPKLPSGNFNQDDYLNWANED